MTSETVGAQGHVLVSEKGNDHSGGRNLFVGTQCQPLLLLTHMLSTGVYSESSWDFPFHPVERFGDIEVDSGVSSSNTVHSG